MAAPRVRSARLVDRRSHTVGRPPGVLPDHSATAPVARVSAVHYNEHTVDQLEDLTAAQARALADRPGVTWIEVVGVADLATIAAFGEAFGLHPLLVEDLASVIQRPKLELYDPDEGSAHVFVVARMVQATGLDPSLAYTDNDPSTEGHTIEQVALVLGPSWVLTFREGGSDAFGPIRDRIVRGAGRIRCVGADYLLYAILDMIVDHMFGVLERIGDAAEALETRTLDDPSPQLQATIAGLRRETVVLRRAVWPLREVLAALQREDVPYVEDRTRPYLRDAYDHLIQAVEILESLREVLGSLFDLYLSAIGTRQNEVMRVLTVVGTIFLPLSFLASLYGMNFDVMPELHWRWGYPALLGVMVGIAVGTLTYFRRKGWL